MIDITAYTSTENPLNYCHATYNGGYLDDQLWVLAMSMACYLDKTHHNIGEMRNTAEDTIL